MPGLLGRDLTKEETALAERLRIAAQQRGAARESAALIRHIALNVPHMLCAAALAVLESETDTAVLRWLYAQLMEGPEFLTHVLNPDQFTRSQQIEICRYLMIVDPLFDVRLARLTPGRQAETSPLDTKAVVQVLDILDHISPGPRLILLLQHLTRHADSRIASKATLLIGKRLRNEDFVTRQLESPDSRVRASTIEGLWYSPRPESRARLWAGLKDKNNRVVGNALIGLHRLGESAVREFVMRMIEDPRPPFRWTAAWVMGQITGEDFLGPLEQAAADPDPQVRRSAEKALQSIRRSAQEPGAGESQPAVVPPDGPVPPASAHQTPDTCNLKFDGQFVTPVPRKPADQESQEKIAASDSPVNA